MDNKKSKILTIITAVIGIIGAILFIRVLMAEEGTEAMDSAVNTIVHFSKILLIVTALIAVGLSLFSMLKNPKALKKTLLGLVVLAVLFGISYAMASDAAVTNQFGDIVTNGEAGSTSKMISTLIIFTGILGALAIGTIGFGFVKSFIK
ncbi:MAG TPA: hypothetical protein DDZ39_09185 [Flavobacteriaceae bacterium]|jgi:hypothetical protein|nr:hypothetical protein [Flavobacteriaceae bacterium]HBS12165.1 hypothetical protein [Flavobacteriaceae bacterium]